MYYDKNFHHEVLCKTEEHKFFEQFDQHVVWYFELFKLWLLFDY